MSKIYDISRPSRKEISQVIQLIAAEADSYLVSFIS